MFCSCFTGFEVSQHKEALANVSSVFSSMLLTFIIVGVKCKAIPVTGRGGPQGCETSRLPHFLDNRFTDGGEVVSLTRRPPFIPTKIPGTHFS
jgi:hypothetical protein